MNSSQVDFGEAFEMLDVDEDGELSIDEFTAGLSQLQVGSKFVDGEDGGARYLDVPLEVRIKGDRISRLFHPNILHPPKQTWFT